MHLSHVPYYDHTTHWKRSNTPNLLICQCLQGMPCGHGQFAVDMVLVLLERGYVMRGEWQYFSKKNSCDPHRKHRGPKEGKTFLNPFRGGWMGGFRCRMSIIRKGNVALSNLRNSPVALSNSRNSPVALSN